MNLHSQNRTDYEKRIHIFDFNFCYHINDALPTVRSQISEA